MSRKHFRSHDSYDSFRFSVSNKQRYALESSSKVFIQTLLSQIQQRTKSLKQGQILWRAQLGHGWSPIQDPEGNWIEDAIPGPFPPPRMKPLRDSARQGRINPAGIPYLYLAADRKTAMMETRPWIGALVSVGQFQTIRKLNVIDLSPDPEFSPEFIYFEEPPPKERDQVVWSGICRAFSKPVSAQDNRAEYAATQIITDHVKQEGFDGVAYRSSLTDNGLNICLFDIEDAELCNCFLHSVEKIDMKFSDTMEGYYIRKKNESLQATSIESVLPPENREPDS